MIADAFQELAARQRRRAGGLAPQARDDLRAMRSTSSGSKCGEVSARCSSSKASSLLSLSMRSDPRKYPARGEAEFDGAAVQALVEGLGIEVAGALVDQAGDHVADADLPTGSWVEPPPKAYSIAIRGTVASCTNQASMPPGETRRWIFAAHATAPMPATTARRRRPWSMRTRRQ